MNQCDEEKISTRSVEVTLSVHPTTKTNLASKEDIGSSEESNEKNLFYFEGVEKIVEVYFSSLKKQNIRGLRDIKRTVWDDILREGKCSILVKDSNSYCDSYILSESSLFVYPNKVIIKTCGKTTPLSCIPMLESHARKEHGLEMIGLGFHRKNYSFPKDQIGPHRSFEDEVRAIRCMFPKLQGDAHMIGTIDGEHWVTYNAGITNDDDDDVVMHLLCYDMDSRCTSMFFQDSKNTSESVTKRLELESLICGGSKDDAMMHAHMFEPCGYSMNGLKGSKYVTVHVTPESHCSYASFETNCNTKSHVVLMTEILRKLRPKRFTVVRHGTYSSDKKSIVSSKACLSDDPTKMRHVKIDEIDHYVRQSRYNVSGLCSVSHFSTTANTTCTTLSAQKE